MLRDKTNLLPGSAAAPLLRYEEAKRAVEVFIRKNGLKPGDRIPTEAELRAQFGWSRVTINRALNELVGKGVLHRIQGSGTYVAEPERLERSLRIMVSTRPYDQQDDYCSPLFAGIREEAGAQQNVDIVYFNDDPIPNAETVARYGVDGVLTLSWELDDQSFALRLHRAGVPVVSLALRARAVSLPQVFMDHYGGMIGAVEYLAAKGHRRIGFVTLRIENSDVSERLLGFQAAHARLGIPVDPALMLLGNDVLEDALLESWWDRLAPRPTAILVHSAPAPRMLALLRNRNVSIPGELSVVCIDDMQMARHYSPPLTVLSQSAYQLGRSGLAKLTRMLRGEDDGRPELLATELIERESVAAPIE